MDELNALDLSEGCCTSLYASFSYSTEDATVSTADVYKYKYQELMNRICDLEIQVEQLKKPFICKNLL